jgi:hypothetical protein
VHECDESSYDTQSSMHLGVHRCDKNGYDMQGDDDAATVALAALSTPRGFCTLRIRRRQAARPASAAP